MRNLKGHVVNTVKELNMLRNRMDEDWDELALV